MNSGLAKSIEILDKMKSKRCQCSRDKTVERACFDRVMKIISTCETADEAIEKLSVHIEPRNRDAVIMKTVYNYGIEVLNATRQMV